MAEPKYDSFLIQVLRQVRDQFSFITPDYPHDLPADLTWVLVSALMAEKYVSVKEAAQVVHDFCVRRGHDIPPLMHSTGTTTDTITRSKTWREIH